MKQVLKTFAARIILTMFTIISGATYILAQDGNSNTTTTTTKETTSFVMQPWMWIVAGAVFILILVALVRGSKKDVTVTKTTTIDEP